MKYKSEAFVEAVHAYGREWANEVVFTNGQDYEVYTACDIKIDEPFSEDALSMGKAFTKQLTLKVKEPQRTLLYNLCKITVHAKLKLSNGYDVTKMGDYFASAVNTPDEYQTLEITAYDTMGKLDVPYEPQSTIQTDTDLLNDIVTQYSLTLASGTHGLNVPITLVEGTVKEQLGYLAGLQGKNAIFDMNGYLCFRWYTSAEESGTVWNDLDMTWNEISGIWNDYSSEYYKIPRSEQKERGVTISEGEFTISSITSGTESNPITVGTGKGITFENPYITQELLNTIGSREIGLTYRTGELKTFGNPAYDTGDIVSAIGKNDEKYNLIFSHIFWDFTGGCSTTITSIGSADAEIEFSTESPTEKKISKIKTTLQGVVERFSNLINSVVGYFTLTEDNGIPTGWEIKDDLSNPQKMIKASLGGIGISSDGGQTYKIAITGDGIVADTITAGTIHAIRYESLYSQEWFGVDYTSADASRMEAIMGGEPPTQADLDKYDFLMNGDFYDTGYAFACEELIVHMAGGDPIEKLTLEIGFQITPDDARVLEMLVDLYETRTDSSVVHIWGFPKIVFSTSSFCTSFANGILKCTSFNTTGALTPDYSDDGKVTLDEGLFQFRTRNSRTGNMQENGYIKGTGYASFVNVTQTSRESTKKNIKPFNADALSIVNDAEIYKFNFKSDEKDETTHLGFVIPDEGGNYKVPDIVCNKEKTGIDTYSMCSILWKAVQELTEKVEDLERSKNNDAN